MARAKFKVNSVEHFESHGDNVYFKVSATPVDGGDPEDFNKWTPSGTLELSITNPELKDFFVPGKKYYADFSSAD